MPHSPTITVSQPQSSSHDHHNPILEDFDYDNFLVASTESYKAEKAKGKSLVESSTPAPVDPYVLQERVLELEQQVATQNSKIQTLEANQGYLITLVCELKKQIDDVKGKQNDQVNIDASNDDNDQGGGDDGGNDKGDHQDDTQESDPFNFEYEGNPNDPKDGESSQHLDSDQGTNIQDDNVESSSDSEMERLNKNIDDEVNIPSSTTNVPEADNTRIQKELPPWKMPPGPPSETHVTVNIESYYSKRGDRSGIASWAFDSEKNMYVVKIKSGRLEYYKRANDFSSLTKLDLQQLNEVYFENRGRNGQAEMFRTFLNE
ncbi:hypothetical protein L1987_80568 [Smallanthus sonchifolius]|uniref:Uncharacterized protein n=1 Tax=Smallanthus sonchifolius TaxID=185202 RepID=A0ACB8YM99_9ASTR|nr:hypothetical protein L1987_80568 [Smallanthus sonchifolius]